MRLLAELRRRNVTRAAAAYAALAWLLIQVGDAVFAAFGLGEAAQRYLILALAIGFVPAMVLAWVFELTPDGVMREADLAADAPLRARTNRLLDRTIMGLLALAVGYFALDKFLLDPARDAARLEQASAQAAAATEKEMLRDARGARTIAVLPFDNMSADPEQEYFSDGIAEEVLNLLARIPELSVTSRTSAFAFKGKNTGLAEIAQQLGVSYVLEGSVRKQGNRVRITTQLIDARSDTHLWSETYDRTLEDVFAVQDDVAAQVVAQLQLKLLGGLPRARSTDPQAHEHLLRARQWMRSWVIADLKVAQEELRRAIAIDPEYPETYALLADALLIGEHTLSGRPSPAVRAEADALLDKALALDPRLGEAWVARAVLEDDPAKAEEYMRRGLQLSPSYARGWEVLADLVSAEPGRAAEALELIDRARALDPLLPRSHHIKAYILAEQIGDHAGARTLWQQLLASDPRFRSALSGLAALEVYTGEYADGLALLERAFAIDPDARFLRDRLIGNYLRLGDVAAAQSVAPSPDDRVALHMLIAQRDWSAALARYRALDAAQRAALDDPELVADIVLRNIAAIGGAQAARATLEQALRKPGEASAAAARFSIARVALAQLMQATGDEAGARRVLQEQLALLDTEQQLTAGTPKNVAMWQAMVLANLGETGAALAALERATLPAPSGWALPWHRDDPLYAPLHAEPRYQAAWDRVEAHAVRQRERLEQLRARGEVPRRP